MNVEAIRCPACGGSLNISLRQELVTCPYCGSTIKIQMKNNEERGKIIDKATGLYIGDVNLPPEFEVIGMLMPNASSNVYPLAANVAAYDKKGNVLSWMIGEGFCDDSKCPMLRGPYSAQVNQVSRMKFKNFMEIRQYVDNYAKNYAQTSKASGLRFIEERTMPLYSPFDRAAALENFKRRIAFEAQCSGMTPDITGWYLEGSCRVYGMKVQETEFFFAITTVLEGVKYKIPDMGMGGMDLLGGLFGNLFNAGNKAPQAGVTPGAFNDMPHNSVIEWRSNGIFMIQSLPSEFEAAFKGAYTDFISTFCLSQSFKDKEFSMQEQIRQAVNQTTQNQLNQMNRQFQVSQQIHREQQAAFDAANQAWWDRSNAHHASFMASSRQQFNNSSPDFSEAIRGVNTYVRPDGREVEVSVAYDRAYTNASGDVLGSNSAFEPGGSWQEMRRK